MPFIEMVSWLDTQAFMVKLTSVDSLFVLLYVYDWYVLFFQAWVHPIKNFTTVSWK
jgi:hypothetical protein